MNHPGKHEKHNLQARKCVEPSSRRVPGGNAVCRGRLFFWLVSGFVWLGLVPMLVAQQQPPSAGVPEELLTVAEKSDFKSTSLSSEVVDLLNRLEGRAEHLKLHEFGRTLEDRPMLAAVLADPPYELGAEDPRLKILVIGNIHSGECAGKEGLLMLLRDLALFEGQHPWLEKAVLIVAPNYSADANDQVAPNNRPGQLGPDNGMGQRPNMMGLDLNRDFVKLESPEARNLVGLINRVSPEVFIDCHTTDGSIHRYELTYDIPHNPATSPILRTYLRSKMMPAVTSALEAQQIDAFYYGNFSRDRSRWTTYGYEPRYSTEFFGMWGGLGILSEAYAYISFKDRILASKAFVTECIEFATAHDDEIRKLVRDATVEFVEQATTNPQALQFPLSAKVTAFEQPATIKGRDRENETDQDYTCEFWGKYEPVHLRKLPFAYVLPADLAGIVEQLQRHGIQVEKLPADWEGKVETYTIQKIERATRAFQKHQMVAVEAELAEAGSVVAAGSYVVRTGQPRGRLVAYLLEPESADGLVTWNFFDDYLEEGQPFPVRRIANPVEIDARSVNVAK